MRELDFSLDQEMALTRIEAWRSRRHPTMTLGGYAGTGKTTLTAYLARHWRHCAVAALCGKAANVLRQKGIEAQTIHSLIYVPFEDAQGKVRYRKRDRLNGYETVIIDEASMVDHLLLQDLLSFDLPILFVGDHGQLEPIGTNPNLMKNPEVRLENIHRQAQGNPILRLAAAVREGRPVPHWCSKSGGLHVAPRGEFWRQVRPGVQIICGFNKTRHAVNRRVRELAGRKSPWPEPGDRLICLQNNQTYGLFNGQQFTCREASSGKGRYLDLDLEKEDGSSAFIPVLKAQFGQDALKDHKDQSVCLMDYGNCVTCHKAQGSEYDEVLAVDEIGNAWSPQRWRYTCVTRAKERLTYCL